MANTLVRDPGGFFAIPGNFTGRGAQIRQQPLVGAEGKAGARIRNSARPGSGRPAVPFDLHPLFGGQNGDEIDSVNPQGTG